MKKLEGQVFNLHGEWKVMLDGEVLPHSWNSKGAAEAGLETERRRKADREKKKPDSGNS